MAKPNNPESPAWPVLSRVYGSRAVLLHRVTLSKARGEPVEGLWNPPVNSGANPARVACQAIESAAQFLVYKQLTASLERGKLPLLKSVQANFNEALLGPGILSSTVTEEDEGPKEFVASIALRRGEAAAGVVNIVGQTAVQNYIRLGKGAVGRASVDDVRVPEGASVASGQWQTTPRYATGHFRGVGLNIIPGYYELLALMDAADQALSGHGLESSGLRRPLAKGVNAPTWLRADFTAMIGTRDEVDYKAWQTDESAAAGVLYARGLQACEAEIRW